MLAVAVGTAVWWLFKPSGDVSITPVSAEPLGVTYVKATKEIKNPQGETEEIVVMDIWIDEETKDARLEIRSADGTLRRVQARSGNEFADYEPGWQSASVHSYPSDSPHLRQIENILWMYRDIILRNPDRAVSEARVNGVTALEVRVPAIDGEVGIAEFRVFVDKSTYLPLKEVPMRREPDGSLVEAGIAFTEYDVITVLPRESLPSDFFTLSLPSGTGVEAYNKMTLQQAQQFSGFTLHYLGDTFNGMPLQLIQEFQTTSPVAPDTHYVHFIYYDPSKCCPPPEQVVVTNYPVMQPEGPLVKPSGPSEKVSVAGREATLYDRPGQAIVAIETGTTIVTVSARSRDAALDTAAALRPLQ